MDSFSFWVFPIFIVLFLGVFVFSIVYNAKMQMRKQKVLDEGIHVTGVIVAGKLYKRNNSNTANPTALVKFKISYESPFEGRVVEYHENIKETGTMPEELRLQMFEYADLGNIGNDIASMFAGTYDKQRFPNGRYGYEERLIDGVKWKVLRIPLKVQLGVIQVKGKDFVAVDWEKTFSEENILDIGGLPRA